MADTRHLDTALRILRAPARRRTAAGIQLVDMGPAGVVVLVAGREVATLPTIAAALEEATRRADAAYRLTGKRPRITGP